MTCLDQSEASIGPEPVEADEHDQGLDEELGEEEPEEGLEIMEHSVELNELSQ